MKNKIILTILMTIFISSVCSAAPTKAITTATGKIITTIVNGGKKIDSPQRPPCTNGTRGDIQNQSHKRPCRQCAGYKKIRCRNCGGRGQIQFMNPFGQYETMPCPRIESCPRCWGTGIGG